MVRGKLKKSLLHIATILSLSATLFVTDVSAKSGATGTEYNSKGTVTDEYDINIDFTDIYTLDDAIDANNKTLENYAVTAGDIYNNLSAIDSAVAKAKTKIAQSLEDMNIYVSRTDAGAVNSHAGTTDWVGTTTAAKSAAVANYTLEELIGQMKTSVTGVNSEMTAKINAGDFRSKKATSSVSSGSQPIKLAGATEINLDKNQQLVLPSGYYGNGMTINNVISGETLNWNPSGIATLTIDRAYTSGTISTYNAYQAGRAEGYGEGHAAGVRKTGGLIIDGWGHDPEYPGVTECYVYPGKYVASFVYQTYAKYVPGFKVYLDNKLIDSWNPNADSANKGAKGYRVYDITYEGTLRCEAYSSGNTDMLFLHGAILRQ